MRVKLKKGKKAAGPAAADNPVAPRPAQAAKRKVPSTPTVQPPGSKKARQQEKTATKKKKKISKKKGKAKGSVAVAAIGPYSGPRSKKVFSWSRPTDGTAAGLVNPNVSAPSGRGKQGETGGEGDTWVG